LRIAYRAYFHGLKDQRKARDRSSDHGALVLKGATMREKGTPFGPLEAEEHRH